MVQVNIKRKAYDIFTRSPVHVRAALPTQYEYNRVCNCCVKTTELFSNLVT